MVESHVQAPPAADVDAAQRVTPGTSRDGHPLPQKPDLQPPAFKAMACP